MTGQIINILEWITLVTPFGLRFWDAVSGIAPRGLVVTAYPPYDPSRRVRAVTNPSGVYSFHKLPGLHDFEIGTGDKDFWKGPIPKRPFIIEVVDKEGRFQPFRLTEELPLRRLFEWRCQGGSPPANEAFVPLFSAPTRPVPGAMAVIRVQLKDPKSGFPAAWAVVEAYVAGRPVARGVSDKDGGAVLIFPYPDLLSFDHGSPPSGPQAVVPLTEQKWSVELRAAYAPVSPVPDIPHLCETLTQSPANLWKVWDGTVRNPLPEVELRFGEELVIRSKNMTNDVLPELLITPMV